MLDVFESRCLPDLLDTEFAPEELEDRIMVVDELGEEEDELEPWQDAASMWDEREEWEDEERSEFENVTLDDLPDFIMDETQYRFFLTLVDRLKMEFPVSVSLQDVGVQDLDRLLQNGDEEGYDFEVLDDAVELVRYGIFVRLVSKYLGPEGADLDPDLVEEVAQSDIGMEMACDWGSSSIHNMVRTYLVFRLDEYFKTIAGEAGMQE